jgi:hypothetical protein
MAIGGGSFMTTNKVLPGAYINFVSQAKALGNLSSNGTVALPLALNWGEEDGIMTLEAEAVQKDSLNSLGYSYTSKELKALREVLQYAKTLKLFRLNGQDGTKAIATIGDLTVTARYKGIRGNDLRLTIQASVDEPNKYEVITYIENNKVDTQLVGTISELVKNDFVSFDGSGDLEPTAGVQLTGGVNGSVTGEAYSRFLDQVEAEKFNVVGYAGNDDLIKNLFVAFTKRLRDEEGYKIKTVLYNYPQADFEGIISVKNSSDLVYWVMGAVAGAEVNQSLTNRIYNGEFEFNTKYKKSEFEAAIQKGEFTFYQDGEKIRVLADINTFTSFTSEKGNEFSSNRLVRVLDQIANDVANIFSSFYLGKVTNNATGRTIFKNEVVNYLEKLQDIQAIENFVQEDIEVLEGSNKKDVIVNVSIQPTDAMEKLYMSVQVR